METWSHTVEDSALIQPRLSLQQLQCHKAVSSPCQALPQAIQVFTTAGTFGISKILHGKTPWGMEPTAELLCLLSAPSCPIIPADVWMILFTVPKLGRFLRSVHVHAHTHTHLAHTRTRAAGEHCWVLPENKEAIDTERPFLDI